jgi:hypothetical protein
MEIVMKTPPLDDLFRQAPEISLVARRLLKPERFITDDLRLVASQLRGRRPDGDAGQPTDIGVQKQALNAVIQSLKIQVAQVIESRAKSEKTAERLLVVGGVVVLCLPVALTVSNLLGLATGWISNLFNGLSTAGFAALMFGPGREIRRAAKDRTALLLLPIAYEARVATSATIQDLQAVAGDLETTLRSLAVPGGSES